MSVAAAVSTTSPWSKYPLPETGEVVPAPDRAHQFRDTFYPDCEENPIPESEDQHVWAALIEDNLRFLFADDPLVYVNGDMFWYPEEGNRITNLSPDVFVAFGRPKGLRRSYKQWEEGGIALQVIFEILSESNTRREMAQKRLDYERHGVLEYYEYDTTNRQRRGWHRRDTLMPLERVPNLNGWVSPLLGIRFGETEDGDLRLFHPNGDIFESSLEKRQKLRLAEAAREVTETELKATGANLELAETALEAIRAEREAMAAERDAALKLAAEWKERFQAMGGTLDGEREEFG